MAAFPTLGGSQNLRLVRSEDAPDQVREITYFAVTEGYFNALGLYLVSGRAFQATDTVGSEPVVVVSESAAKSLWPAGASLLGRRIQFGSGSWFLVIGVVKDVLQRGPQGLDIEPKAQMYGLYRQDNSQTISNTVVRTNRAAADVISNLRRHLNIGSAVPPVRKLQPVEEIVAAIISPYKSLVTLVSLFTALSLLLAAVGAFAVLAYLVSRRRHEFGVRMALGAQPQQISSLVLRRGMRPVGIGLIAGFVLSVWSYQFVQQFVLRLAQPEYLSIVLVFFVFVLAGLAATCIPSRHAARSDVVNLLRAE